MQPGTTITPGSQGDEPQPSPSPTDQQPVAPAPEQPTAPKPVEPAPPAPEVPTPQQDTTQTQDEPATNWRFNEGRQTNEQDVPYETSNMEPISWTASEYIDHEKNNSWFLGIGGATVAIALITYFLTQDIVSSVVVVIAGALLIVSGVRKPRTLSYLLDDNGLQVGSNFYPYASFKSFTVLEEGALTSVQLLPTRRFMPSISIYYPPDQEEAIITGLGNFLPHEERKRDAVDSLMRRIKF